MACPRRTGRQSGLREGPGGRWHVLLGGPGRTGPRVQPGCQDVHDLAFDVNKVRAAYPALADGYAYLDGAAGTQLPAAVIDAIAGAYRAGLGNAGGSFPASRRSDAITAECRAALADLTGGQPEGIILGPNMTTLTYRLARSLAAGWRPGDEVVVTRLDHDANVRPWVQAAARAGAMVRWAEVDLATGDLPAAQFGESDRRPDPAGRGDRRQQCARYPAGRGRDHRRRARGGRGQLRRRRPCDPARPG